MNQSSEVTYYLPRDNLYSGLKKHNQFLAGQADLAQAARCDAQQPLQFVGFGRIPVKLRLRLEKSLLFSFSTENGR